jgi:hypothetical protein
MFDFFEVPFHFPENKSLKNHFPFPAMQLFPLSTSPELNKIKAN